MQQRGSTSVYLFDRHSAIQVCSVGVAVPHVLLGIICGVLLVVFDLKLTVTASMQGDNFMGKQICSM